ncbi:MAG: hypothetical protein AAF961_15050, partial [Planctomycetota bacterium]
SRLALQQRRPPAFNEIGGWATTAKRMRFGSTVDRGIAVVGWSGEVDVQRSTFLLSASDPPVA